MHVELVDFVSVPTGTPNAPWLGIWTSWDCPRAR
jgi:hypothetical protein